MTITGSDDNWSHSGRLNRRRTAKRLSRGCGREACNHGARLNKIATATLPRFPSRLDYIVQEFSDADSSSDCRLRPS